MSPGDDIHGRSAGLSKACFYRVMEECNHGYDAVMLGLRSEESGIRRHLRVSRGRYYELVDGTRRVLPIADWTGIDVYAYAESNGIDLLPMYRCVAFAHRDEPWRLRKSWWLPGSGTAYGQTAWLRRYYPSLYRQMCAWMPDSRRMT
jgi:3'-phosphoadenosine 5'-phosphosulfate sulfotransferase (PAPS reductase)/FAD synthetase